MAEISDDVSELRAARFAIDPASPLDELSKCDGVSRDVLEARLAVVVARLKLAELRNAQNAIAGCLTCKGCENYKHMLENMTHVQGRCTELLDETRAQRAELARVQARSVDATNSSGLLPGWTCPKCAGFNGEAKERLVVCRACGTARPL